MSQIISKLRDNSYSKSMKILLLITLLMAVFGVREASSCNVCHSKNPKMVRMHEELGFKGCFKCHGQGLAKSPDEQKTQMASDERCTPCHKRK